jgi:hypothetical protein
MRIAHGNASNNARSFVTRDVLYLSFKLIAIYEETSPLVPYGRIFSLTHFNYNDCCCCFGTLTLNRSIKRKAQGAVKLMNLTFIQRSFFRLCDQAIAAVLKID